MNTVIKVSRELHKSKNLIDWSKYIKSGYGLVCTEISSGVFQIKGKSDASYRRISGISEYDLKKVLTGNKTYRLSIGVNSNDLYAQMLATDIVTGVNTYHVTTVFDPAFTIDYKKYKYTFNIITGAIPKEIDFTIYPKIFEGTTPTPFKPYKNNYLPIHLLNRRPIIFE